MLFRWVRFQSHVSDRRKNQAQIERVNVLIDDTANEDGLQDQATIFLLRLYVAGQTPRSIAAFANLKMICETYLKGQYTIEVVDLLVTPALARGDQIVAVPSVVRQLPPPVKKLIGDLADTERVLVGLDLRRRLA